MPKVSIIIPVYNTEKYLRNTLESVINQTYIDKVEIVIVNDGSTDNSEDIILEYKEKYDEIIKYYKKKNEGIAKARNFGIEKAIGEYILFVDSDDIVKKDLVEKIYPYMDEDIDCIKFKLEKVDEKGLIIEKIDGPIFECCSGEEGFNKLFGKDILIDSPCIYIVKKSVYMKNNLNFERTYHEDFGLIPFVLVCSSSIVSTPYYLYEYIQRNDSIIRNQSNKKTIQKMEDSIYHYDNAIKRIESLELEKTTKENLKIFYTNSVILKIETLNEADKEKYISEIRKRRMYKNIKARNFKQLIKKMVLKLDIKLYLKLR